MTGEELSDIIQLNLGQDADKPGLHYAVFLSKTPYASGYPQGQNFPALKKMLWVYGWLKYRTAEQQVELWDARIREVERSFQQLENAAAAESPGRHLKRLVLDVEVGGIMYAAVGDYGSVFAATLSQLAMNSGKAEGQFVKIAEELLIALSRPGPACPDGETT